MSFISVIIPFYNVETYIGACLEGLYKQIAPSMPYEIILIDNNSTDTSASIASRFPQAILLSEPRQGAYAARNRGLKAAKGDIMAFTDPDCVPAEDWLTTIETTMASTDVDIVVGSHSARGAYRALTLFAAHREARNEYIFTSSDPMLYYGLCNNMVIRKSVFESSGDFEENLRGSDTRLVRKYLDSHHCDSVRYVERLSVRHKETESLRGQLHKLYVHGDNAMNVNNTGDQLGRDLNRVERNKVIWAAVEKKALGPFGIVYFFLLLLLGRVFWTAGAMSRRLKNRE
ncbi:MAG: glycosyltransferase [Candidatus Latescibacteria bacterium]|nr:glycosyltransferase [Candidatus Latescibacterota bacterium]